MINIFLMTSKYSIPSSSKGSNTNRRIFRNEKVTGSNKENRDKASISTIQENYEQQKMKYDDARASLI